jgi:hypothetical protein
MNALVPVTLTNWNGSTASDTNGLKADRAVVERLAKVAQPLLPDLAIDSPPVQFEIVAH